jgi:hypothetical protein
MAEYYAPPEPVNIGGFITVGGFVLRVNTRTVRMRRRGRPDESEDSRG